LEDKAQSAPYSDEDLEPLVEVSDPVESPHGISEAEAISGPATSGSPEPELFVEVGDRVTYETMTEPIERHTVQIVDSISNLRLNILNDQTPLAQALLGLCIGDDAQLNLKEKVTRKMRVLAIIRQSVDE
jgi:transcription elongation GreA/GreB family factor